MITGKSLIQFLQSMDEPHVPLEVDYLPCNILPEQLFIKEIDDKHKGVIQVLTYEELHRG